MPAGYAACLIYERRGELLQRLLAGRPAQQRKVAALPDRVIEIRVGAFDGVVRVADLLPARSASIDVGVGLGASERRWTRSLIIEAMRAWRARYYRLPSSYD